MFGNFWQTNLHPVAAHPSPIQFPDSVLGNICCILKSPNLLVVSSSHLCHLSISPIFHFNKGKTRRFSGNPNIAHSSNSVESVFDVKPWNVVFTMDSNKIGLISKLQFFYQFQPLNSVSLYDIKLHAPQLELSCFFKPHIISTVTKICSLCPESTQDWQRL